MPTMKSSTLIEPTYKALLQKLAAEGDYLSLLNELLAVIHRDGGHYTILVGVPASVEDAMGVFYDLRSQLQSAVSLRRKRPDD